MTDVGGGILSINAVLEADLKTFIFLANNASCVDYGFIALLCHNPLGALDYLWWARTFIGLLHNQIDADKRQMSRLVTKPAKWHVRPAKTLRRVFAVRSMGS